jgi:hypothetical protein
VLHQLGGKSRFNLLGTGLRLFIRSLFTLLNRMQRQLYGAIVCSWCYSRRGGCGTRVAIAAIASHYGPSRAGTSTRPERCIGYQGGARHMYASHNPVGDLLRSPQRAASRAACRYYGETPARKPPSCRDRIDLTTKSGSTNSCFRMKTSTSLDDVSNPTAMGCVSMTVNAFSILDNGCRWTSARS